MATFQRLTKNSTKNQNRQSLNSSKNSTPGRAPTTVTQQYTELDEKINRLLASNVKLENQVGTLLEKIGALETQNDSLKEDNAVLRADHIKLSAKLVAAEVKLSSIESDFESSKQKSLQKTVELLEVPEEAAENILGFVKTYAEEIGCAVLETDLDNFYSRTHKTRKNTTKTKIVLEFTSLKKRKEFYFAGREHRFERKNQQQQSGRYRFIKVVDALTQYKKSIFFNIIDHRKTNKDVVKNVWISDGEIFVRRFGSNAAEPVKNQAFVDLLFPAHREDEEDEEDEDGDE
jgi:regulator of replication initiation timing